MKKSVMISAIIIILILLTTNVYASISAKASLNANNTNLKPGDTVIVVLSLNDISYSNLGLMGIEGILNYNKDVFEEISENNIAPLNGWDRAYNVSTGKIIIEGNNQVTSDTNIAQIELKVKSTVKAGVYNDAVRLINAEAYNTETVSISDTSFSVNITEDGNGNNDGNQNDNIVALTRISIKTKPIKTTYTEKEKFDPTGMVLTVEYSDGKTKDITSGYTYLPSNELTTDVKEITIAYTENGVTKTTAQSIVVNVAKNDNTNTDNGNTQTGATSTQDKTKANETIPQTGVKKVVLPVIGVVGIISVISIVLYKRNNIL